MEDEPCFSSVRPERLLGVVQIWLWEFEEPENWPSPQAVRATIKSLEGRTDAARHYVQMAIAECRNYLEETQTSDPPMDKTIRRGSYDADGNEIG